MGIVQKFRRLKHSDPPKFKVPAHTWRRLENRRRRPFQISALTFPIGLLLIGAVGVGYYGHNLLNATASPLKLFAGRCNIKGNVSIDTGERIYHVPGQKYYERTRIRSEYGERWFCSEAEARKAGWRKAKR
jgi:hypothetical protein